MQYVLEIWEKLWKCTVNKNFKLRFFQNCSSYILTNQCLYRIPQSKVGKNIWNMNKIKLKKYIFSSKLLRGVWACMEITVWKKCENLFLQCAACAMPFSAEISRKWGNIQTDEKSAQRIVIKTTRQSSRFNRKINDRCSCKLSVICSQMRLQWNLESCWCAPFRPIHFECG